MVVHCHALINDCDFKFVDSGTRLVRGHDKPLKIDTIKRLHICDKLGCDISDLPVVYNVSDWKYGFSTAIQTYGQMSNLAFYVTKYITKDVKKSSVNSSGVARTLFVKLKRSIAIQISKMICR